MQLPPRSLYSPWSSGDRYNPDPSPLPSSSSRRLSTVVVDPIDDDGAALLDRLPIVPSSLFRFVESEILFFVVF
jgi:hypothetical protein